ncbi:Hypothetical predicted protein [Cloeon dipterum]|uniref:Xenotropic and polytropic retrovirus receptor 1 n=2 Tax=Cloeon dipterum TaxID=197152 RepID=A0A8S1DEJ2_9INSE|nr:Hypothetical predicted protein [Cloeon dipterum]
MKFTEHLSAHITPEWRKQYIIYEELKTMLYSAVEEAPSAELTEPEIVTRHIVNFDDHFFQQCDQELKKINTFFSEKMAEATRKFAMLQSELKASLDASSHSKTGLNKARKMLTGGVPARKLQDLKLAFSEFYLSLILLQNYQNLNFTGFRKILKKHDKLLKTDRGAKWRAEHVETSHFYTNKDIDRLIKETESTVTNEMESGNRQRAMKRLRVPPLGEQQSPWTTFKLGLFSGAFGILFVTAILSIILGSPRDDWSTIFQLYRGPFLLILFIFLMGVNVYGWRSSGVNHVLIFELDPRHHLSEQHLMELAAIFGVIWALSLLGLLFSEKLSIPAYYCPVSMAVVMIIFLVNPIKAFQHEARFWLLRVLFRIITAPFWAVGFADFWLADQLNSLVYALIDFHFFICFFFSNPAWETFDRNTKIGIERCNDEAWITLPIVNALPAWFRFAQCLRRYRDSGDAFPHLVNAGKYSTTFFVVLFSVLRKYYEADYQSHAENPFFYAWMVSAIVSSSYSYAWDIKMDWGFFDQNAGENRFLRAEVVYSSKNYYYFAIIEDLLIRFSWAFSFLIVENGYLSKQYMTFTVSILEVVRRFIWNYFRLENEHLNNCGNFRAVRDISVAPLDTSDQAVIVRMMDESDGVLHRRKRRPAKNKDETTLCLLQEEVPPPSGDNLV